ncbi:MAG TPA: hypothetical protein VFN26_23025 [Candidatus Acidoferrum sp.]|nr:hypothetical protein [Candidatus Acidoferrum sp.]
MKFQKIIRGQVVLMGLAGAVLLANSAYAQQDMDPTFFDDTPGTPQAQQAAVVPALQDFQPTPGIAADMTGPLAAQEVEASGFTPFDENVTIFSIVGLGSVVLLGMAEAIRGSRRRTFREKTIGGLPSGATAS